MHISLTPEQERFVEEKLKSGGFESASEVIGSALAMWKSQEELTAEDVEGLRAQILIGLEQARRGESTSLDMNAIKEQARRLSAAVGRKTG
jgi:antitoxin ParD1/3/4